MEQLPLFEASFGYLTVSVLNAYVRRRLEDDPLLSDIWVRGEVANLSRPTSGHIYFSLKDDKASVRCVVWRSTVDELSYLPSSDGVEVLAHGRVSLYEGGGVYQFYIDEIEAAGIGTLHLQFEQLKRRLAEEGLFDPDRKRPLPAFPQRIGVVTSPTGAAFQDILNVLRRRYPLAEVILAPTQVQGEGAAEQMAAALRVMQFVQPDVIILARGGGSLEELWPFNEELVAKAIAASAAPVVSGVGHETDITIADFAADVRAPTPSAAAEVATPDRRILSQQVRARLQTAARLAAEQVAAARSQLVQRVRLLNQVSPRSAIANHRQRLDEREQRLEALMLHFIAMRRERVAGLEARLRGLDPHATLQRGYAIVRDAAGRLVDSTGRVAIGDQINIRVRDGDFDAVVS